MNQTAINKELEKLLDEFQSAVHNYFKEKGIDVQLKTVDFEIIKSVNQISDIKTLSKDMSKSSVEVLTTRCYLNEQGQTVCEN